MYFGPAFATLSIFAFTRLHNISTMPKPPSRMSSESFIAGAAIVMLLFSSACTLRSIPFTGPGRSSTRCSREAISAQLWRASHMRSTNPGSTRTG